MREEMTAPDIDTVVFDLGCVLIDWNPHHLYRKVIADDRERDAFLREICSPEWNAAQDAGRPWDVAVAELSARHPEHAATIALYRDRWPEMLGGVLEETVGILERLHVRGVPLYALTNWSQETFPVAQGLYPFLARFRGILVSGAEGLIKPDPRIYARLCERFGLVAARCLFIDDSPRNVEAARAFGMQALHFTDAAALESVLVAQGLLGGRT